MREYTIAESKSYVKSYDMMVNINQTWAGKEIENYYIYINKLSKSTFLNSKFVRRKDKIKGILNKI